MFKYKRCLSTRDVKVKEILKYRDIKVQEMLKYKRCLRTNDIYEVWNT